MANEKSSVAQAPPGVVAQDWHLRDVHEIARAHGGTLTATSSPENTTFTFRMRGAVKD